MYVDDLTEEHLRNLEPQESQKNAQQMLEPDDPIWFHSRGWVGCEDDGTPFAAVGLIKLDDYGRFRAWTVLGKDLGPRRLWFVAKHVMRWLRHGDYRRVEAICPTWAEDELFWCREVLGMKAEGRLRRWTPDGYDVYMLSRIKED
jgi:hypothetical protein